MPFAHTYIFYISYCNYYPPIFLGLQETGKSGKSGPTSPSEGKSGKSGPTSPSAAKAEKLKTSCISSLEDICPGKSGKSGPTSPSKGKSGKSGPTSPSCGKSGKSNGDSGKLLLLMMNIIRLLRF